MLDVALLDWVAVKKLDLTYHIGKTFGITLYIYIYTAMVTLYKFLNSNPVDCRPGCATAEGSFRAVSGSS